jgi:hypothetical protein
MAKSPNQRYRKLRAELEHQSAKAGGLRAIGPAQHGLGRLLLGGLV